MAPVTVDNDTVEQSTVENDATRPHRRAACRDGSDEGTDHRGEEGTTRREQRGGHSEEGTEMRAQL